MRLQMGATKVRPDEQARGGWRFTRRAKRLGAVALHLGACLFCRTVAALATSSFFGLLSPLDEGGAALFQPQHRRFAGAVVVARHAQVVGPADRNRDQLPRLKVRKGGLAR